MTVTGIRQLTKQKIEISLDGQPAFVLYKGELSRYQIREGQEIPEELYREITGEVLIKRARRYALHLLTKRDYTQRELRQKLERAGYPPEVTEDALAYVKSYRYVDDDRYARRYVEQYKESKSRRQLQQELSRRGVPRELAQHALEEAQGPSERQLIRQLVEKKCRNRQGLTEKEVQRLYGYLARRGFSGSDIGAVLRELDIFDKIEMI